MLQEAWPSKVLSRNALVLPLLACDLVARSHAFGTPNCSRVCSAASGLLGVVARNATCHNLGLVLGRLNALVLGWDTALAETEGLRLQPACGPPRLHSHT